MQMKVRPFTQLVESPGRTLVLEVNGRIDDRTFCFSALGQDHALPTVAVSEDAHGAFALVEPFESEIKPNWWLRVQPEFHEDDPKYLGCEISLTYNPDLPRVEIEIARQGRNPADFNVLATPGAGLSIYFSPSGFVNGKGWTGGVIAAEIPTA